MLGDLDTLKGRIFDLSEREGALEEIVDSGRRDCGGLALVAIGDPRSEVRVLALKAIRQSEGIFDLGLVARALGDQDEIVRIEALEVLAAHSGGEESDKIVELLMDADSMVRAYAAWTLAELDAHSYLPAIRRSLDNPEEDSDLAKAGMLEACIRLDGVRESDLVALISILHSDDHQARSFTANCLVGIATPAILGRVCDALREAIRREHHAGVREALERNLRELDQRRL